MYYDEYMYRRFILKGALWFIGGLLITVISYHLVSGGGRYYITWGAMFYGTILIYKGIRLKIRENAKESKNIDTQNGYICRDIKKVDFTNGDVYIGEISNGIKNGLGCYIWNDGSSYKGYWKDDCMHGIGIYIDTYGNKSEGIWQNDELSSVVLVDESLLKI